jgi:hypothetical protein
VIDLEFATLEREVGNVFRAIQNAAEKSATKGATDKQRRTEMQAPVS